MATTAYSRSMLKVFFSFLKNNFQKFTTATTDSRCILSFNIPLLLHCDRCYSFLYLCTYVHFGQYSCPIDFRNNAGKFTHEHAISEDGVEMTFATNYLGNIPFQM